jgi:hypothetical protein
MSSATDETPQKDDEVDEILSSTIKRDIERRLTTADEMIDSIRSELFTPRPPQQQCEHDDDIGFFHDDDDGEMCDEIKRLPSVEEDIRQDLNSQNMDSIRCKFLREDTAQTLAGAPQQEQQKQLNGIRGEEMNNLWLFSMIALWVIVFLKEWFATLPVSMK